MPISEAVDKAVDECIEQDILREFLLKEKAEVKRMSILECDTEKLNQCLELAINVKSVDEYMGQDIYGEL